MNFLQTEDGPCELETKRLEAVLDKGLIINWQVGQYVWCTYSGSVGSTYCTVCTVFALLNIFINCMYIIQIIPELV